MEERHAGEFEDICNCNLFRASQVGRQNRRCETNTAGITSWSRAITHTRLVDRYNTNPGHHLALRQMAVAHKALAASLSPETHILGEKISDLGLYGLSQQGARPCRRISVS
jgi:hypothetical protein